MTFSTPNYPKNPDCNSLYPKGCPASSSLVQPRPTPPPTAPSSAGKNVLPLLLSLLGFAANASPSTADQNWPQWRGPQANGVAPQANPPVTWSETSNIKWKTKIPGNGSATPIIWDDLIFIQTAVPTGKKIESAGQLTRAEAPDSAPKAGESGEPRRGGGGGPDGPPGRGGPDGFGPGAALGRVIMEAGDKNNDKKLSLAEFTELSQNWFDKLDTEKEGKVSQDKFVEGFSGLMPAPPEGGAGGPGGGGPGGGGPGGGPGRFVGRSIFGLADANKDGSLTRDEFSTAISKWFNEWDSEKTGAITEDKLRDGFNALLPRPQFGGGGPGGMRGGGRRGGGMGGGAKPTEVQQFTVLCLDRKSGKVLWQQVAREEVPHQGVKEGDGTFASNSGLSDGEHFFAYFGSRGLYCYDLKGNLVWSNDFGKMRIQMDFGEGSSPALYKDKLIVNWDNENESFITALDKNTGKTLWKQPREERTSWATPLIIEHGGKAQVLTDATSKIRCYDLDSGKLAWECGGLTRNVIPSPVADADTAYCMSGFMGNSLLAIKLGRTGDLTGTDAIAWTHKKSTPYVPSPLLYGDKLYFFANNNGVLSCLDVKSGQALIDAERLEDFSNVYASPLGAAGRVYLTGRNGATLVIKQSDKLEKLATNKLDDKFDASPAAVGKELFLRGHEYLYCIAEK